MRRKTYTTCLIMLLCCMCGTIALAQSKSDKIKPQWVDGELPQASNPSYLFERHSAWGESLQTARNKCYEELVDNASSLGGAVIYSDHIASKESHQHYINGSLHEEIDYVYQTETKSKGHEHKLYAICVDEYWEYIEGQYYVIRLYAKSEFHGIPIFDEVELSNKYGVEGLVRSLVPGWGQIYKGSKIKGGLIIAGEALGVGGIVTCFSMKASNEMAAHIHPSHAKEYYQDADMWLNIGYGCIAFTAAIYIYNLIDAAIAPGARRVIVLPRENVFTIAPAVTYDGSVGIAMKYNF